jgi:Domain of unknown function (DUF4382)
VGPSITLQKSWLPLLLLSSLCLGSCSGVKKPCTQNCGGNGNATLLVTFTVSPLTPPPSTNLLSFAVNISGVSLTPSGSGAAVNIPLNNSTYTIDLTRLQSDSVFVAGLATVPAGKYSGMTVSLSSPVVTYCTQTAGGTGCASGSVATNSAGAAAAPQITTAPFPLTLSTNQVAGLAVNLNLQNVLTVTASTQVVTAVNLAATNVLSAATLPPTSTLAAGELSFLEDVTGVVTAVTGATQSVTLKTATRGSFTAFANSSTIFSPNCTAFSFSLTFSSCVVQGQVASLDLALKSDGTFILLEYDPLATTTGDWIEGIITAPPSSTTQFQLVTNDLVPSTLIGAGLPLASPVDITLVPSSGSATPKPFVVDSKGLTIPSADPFTAKTDTSALAPGQTVAAHVTAFTAGSSSTLAKANADFLYLRFTRVTTSVSSAAPPVFNAQSFPTFFALTTPITVQLSTGSPSTNFDGISGSSGLTAGQTVSMTALYFGPPIGVTATPTPFSAAKVRVP